MTYDETWDDRPARSLPLAPIAVAVALVALAGSAFVLVRQAGVVSSERSARKAEVARLAKRVAVLESRGTALAGRLGSAEKTLKRRETGIAPLASRVLRSVFTVETENGIGSGFVACPYGLYGTVTTGIVSRVTRRVIQTDAAANPGNSGGPALDKQGHVVGVLVAGGGENINFAIPIGLACAKLRQC